MVTEASSSRSGRGAVEPARTGSSPGRFCRDNLDIPIVGWDGPWIIDHAIEPNVPSPFRSWAGHEDPRRSPAARRVSGPSPRLQRVRGLLQFPSRHRFWRRSTGPTSSFANLRVADSTLSWGTDRVSRPGRSDGCARSSAGQSNGLLNRWSQVRILPGVLASRMANDGLAVRKPRRGNASPDQSVHRAPWPPRGGFRRNRPWSSGEDSSATARRNWYHPNVWTSSVGLKGSRYHTLTTRS